MRLTVYALLLFVSLALVTGCNVIGAAATVVSPPEKIKAKYKLPDKPTLVVIDDPQRLVNSPTTLRRIASATRNVLETEMLVTTGFVGQDELAGYRETLGDRYSQTSLAALAMHLNARQVIHVEVIGFQVELGGNVIRPAIAMNVKVFDLDQRTRVFPPEKDPQTGVDSGVSVYTLQSKLPAQDLTGQSAARSIAVRDLADLAGRDIARLFFDWRKPQPGAELGKPQ